MNAVIVAPPKPIIQSKRLSCHCFLPIDEEVLECFDPTKLLLTDIGSLSWQNTHLVTKCLFIEIGFPNHRSYIIQRRLPSPPLPTLSRFPLLFLSPLPPCPLVSLSHISICTARCVIPRPDDQRSVVIWCQCFSSATGPS